MVVLVMAILMLVGLEKAAVSEHVGRPVLCVGRKAKPQLVSLHYH